MYKMDQVLKGYVDKREAAGVSALVYKAGREIYFGAYGQADIATGKPFGRGTLCHVYSMTKVITSAAMMILIESGACQLDDPVSKYIPAYADMKVARECRSTGQVTFTPAATPLTLRHLLSMTSGISYGDNCENAACAAASNAYAPMTQSLLAAEQSGAPWTAARVARALADVPLCFEPGTRWMYGLGLDIIGGLIEIITGKRLGDYMRENIFEPLDMRDTSFRTSAANVATIYTGSGDKLRPWSAEYDIMTDTQAFDAGGAGIITTIDDYAKFALMLSNNGEWNGVRVMSAGSVALMTADNLPTAALKHSFNWLSEHGYSYGLAVRIMQRPDESEYADGIGAFGWNGMAGTSVRIDPANGTVALFFVQHVPGEHELFLIDFTSAVRALERGE